MVLERCTRCRRYASPPRECGTKPLYCSCGEALTNPAIFQHLVRLSRDLEELEADYKKFGGSKAQAAWRASVEKQHKILENLAQYPGFHNTHLARFDRFRDLEMQIDRLLRYETWSFSDALRAIFRILTGPIWGLPQLGRGPL